MRQQALLYAVGTVGLIGAAVVEAVTMLPMRDAIAGVFSVTCWVALVKLGYLGDVAKQKLEAAYRYWFAPTRQSQSAPTITAFHKNIRAITLPAA